MWSFASTPGNCFVMPRSSRTTGRSLILRGDSTVRGEGVSRERRMQSFVGGSISPERIIGSSSFIWSMKSCGTSGLIWPTPTPSLSRSNTRSWPPVNSPFSAAVIASKTATSTRLTALVRMCGPRNAWSVSTPMPHT